MNKTVHQLLIFPIALWLAFWIFPISAGAENLETVLKQSKQNSYSHIQNTLTELAQNNDKQKPRSCPQAGSVEKCATCCRDILNACVAMVIPLCHQGDPSRAEFRHCLKDKESHCQTDFGNCAWLCKGAE